MEARDDRGRPSIGRMKDSDDYITARAANPWTGLISPSPGTQTPCSSTPNSPGDALNIRRRTTQQESPTHVIRKRPILAMANEGRKVNGGSGRDTTVEHEYRFVAHDSVRVGKSMDLETPALLHEDQFIVHMPSAREPQPFAYPGYSPEQIEALEHYRCKARRVSSEGYDRRLFHERPVDSEHIAAQSNFSGDHIDTHYHHRHFTPYTTRQSCNKVKSPGPPSKLVVRKRENSKVSRILQHSQPRIHANALPPMSGSRIRRMSINEQAPATLIHNHPNVPGGTRSPNKHTGKCSATNVGDDDIDQYIGRTRFHNERSTRIPGAFTDLSHLPRVELVKPEYAAVPEGRRQCSLGCGRDGEVCNKRVNSTGTVVQRSTSLFQKDTTAEGNGQLKMNHTEQLLDYILLSVNYLGSLQLPRVGVFEPLRDPKVSTKEKAEALKAILSLAGHALAVCTLLAMLWKLGTSLIQFFEVVLWPLAVPLRFLKWVLIS